MDRSRNWRRSGASLGVIALVATVGFSMPAFAQEETGATEYAGGDIVVTARKREESLLDAPISISALTSEQLSKKGISSINDMVLNTPGINVSSVNSGRNDRSFQQVSLRGMTPSTTASTLTASFIDGVPVSSATAVNSIADPARIEILKGPQVAYFGRNAFAGAINVVTKEPAKHFGGSISAMAGTRDNFDVSGSLEGPLVSDLIGFRVTGRSYSKSGSYKNATNPGQTLGDQKTDTGTLTLTFTPSSRLKAKLVGIYSENHDGPSAQGFISAYEIRSNNGAVNIPYLSASNAGIVVMPSSANCTLNGYTTGASSSESTVARPFMCGALPSLSYSPAQNTAMSPALVAAIANSNYRVVSADNGADGYGLKSRYYHVHLNLDYELTDALTLTSMTGINNERYSQLQDLDGFDTSAFTNSYATATNGYTDYWDYAYMVERVNKDISQELRLTFENGGPLHAMVGSSYLVTKSKSDLVNVSSEAMRGAARPASSLRAPQKAKTLGIFASASYDFTDALTLNLEGRYQKDKIFAYSGGTTLTINSTVAAKYGLPQGTYDPLTPFYSKTFDNFLPRAILNYNFTRDIMAYASWSKAANVSLSSFNTNILNGSQAFLDAADTIGLGVIVEPEKVTNYEVGLKGKFLNGRLLVTLAGYIADWKNQHNLRSIFVVDNSTNPATTGFVSGTANSGHTIMRGVELDVTAEPLDGFTITASGSINDSSIREFSDPSISKLYGMIDDDFRGNQTPLTSKYSANLGLQYTGEIASWDEGSWFARTDISYKSKQYIDASNVTWIKSRTQVNARLGVTKGAVSLEGFVTNLFNNKRYVSALAQPFIEPSLTLAGAAYGYVAAALPELRTFGIKAGYKF